MAFIYNLTDSWNDVTTTWNGIKLAVTNTASDSSSKLLNLTVSGATTASFTVDKSGNLDLNGKINKITFTAPATAATFTLADNSTFATVGGYATTFTFSGATSLTFPTSGTVTALGNTTTGSGSIVLATSPTLITPALGTPSAVTLTNATGLPVSTGISGFGSGVATALGINVGTAGAFVVKNGALGTPSSGDLSNCTGIPAGGISGTVAIANGGTGQTTANAAFNALAPSQIGNNGKYLTTDGTNTSWATNPLGTVTSVDVSGGTTGLSFSGGPITTSGTITMAGTLAAANGGTGITSLGSGVATWLGTPSSANLAAAVTDETGSGPLVFATSPTFTSAVTLGTQSSTRGSLVLANTTAGSKAVTLQSSNSTAAAYTLTLPAAAPVNGYYLQTDNLGQLSWAAGGGGGGGSPGGSNTQIQYNNSGAFGGDAAFTFTNGGATATMSLGVASTTSGVAKLYNSASANAITLASGNNSAAWTMTLPTSGGTNGYFLQTDGSGNTSWAAAASGTINTGTVGQITYYSGTNALSGTTTGTGVLTALGINVGSAGAFVVNGGALGTPSSGTLTNATGLPISTGVSGLGTNVATALAVNVGTAGAVVVNGGALGTPSSGTLTNATGLPISTGVSGLGTSVATALAVNVGTAGSFVVNGGALGTPSSGTLTNATGLPLSTGVTGVLPVANGGSGTSTAFTAGSVVFAGASGTYTQNNSQIFWDNTNNRLGIGTASPIRKLHVVVAATANTANQLMISGYQAALEIINQASTQNWYFGVNDADSSKLYIGRGYSAGQGIAPSIAIDPSDNILIGGTASRGTTVGNSHLDIFNGVAPAGTLTNGISLYSSSGDFNFMDSAGNGYKVGFRNIPQNAQTSAYVAVAGDVGKHISITTGGVTVNASVFSAGDVFTIYNNSGSNQTITAGASVTFRLAGTATTGNRTLAQYGAATLLCVTGGASPTFVVSGAGVT